jgi:hypothetical protein
VYEYRGVENKLIDDLDVIEASVEIEYYKRDNEVIIAVWSPSRQHAISAVAARCVNPHDCVFIKDIDAIRSLVSNAQLIHQSALLFLG